MHFTDAISSFLIIFHNRDNGIERNVQKPRSRECAIIRDRELNAASEKLAIRVCLANLPKHTANVGDCARKQGCALAKLLCLKVVVGIMTVTFM